MRNLFILTILFATLSSMAFIPTQKKFRPASRIKISKENFQPQTPLNEQLSSMKKIYSHLRKKEKKNHLISSIEKFNTFLETDQFTY
jgi:hypothetical protein